MLEIHPTPAVVETPATRERAGSGAFATVRDRRRYWAVVSGLAVLAVAFAFGVLAWDNPLPVGSPGFWRVAELRATSLVVIAIVVICQAMATVAFQSATNNRIITPSIMGFEALYVAVQTASVFFLGAAGVVALQGVPQFALQLTIMVVFAMLLYGWLLSGKYGNMQVMLLVGIILGGGLGSVSAFMQRLLTPSEFDVLTAKLFGSISNAEVAYLPLAVPLCLAAAGALWWRARRLNLVAMGRDVTTNLGLDHRREVMIVLFLVSVLMAVSTALIGPMTFLGFLVATLAYQFAGTHDHRYIFPVAVLTGFVILTGAYFVLKNIFYAQGAVSIIIEAVGGATFLIVILRKGRL
ncbi:iron chelate uptake ABC transporter family permease subunit [Prescottella equi]|jgi:iron complex transport system permease protein|uniref:iron chelate uptake ABC transporter family permease subunit n=1 Tax=Rhodococcus hoagii TaxID=43767 RepID=UPI000A0FE043|nr:iron chelate uptake ABC transporter family permease subunit [Prescottella equi]MBM4638629.1 iron chelate uptake ABC transporter family permease subunit [Prescottella equi]MBM4669462.1 iron chelate uptake ABC transporter family permease subunit [Prescottella equi]NKR28107.1 iron chelate uptake ABC transporter family permease subunit [Prescottella equi]NKR45246.1 iron chelate uptake ABC transporter family permease subunit [Prescottella equi]NKV88451.1 iron chelate uptake ABC transporter famil